MLLAMAGFTMGALAGWDGSVMIPEGSEALVAEVRGVWRCFGVQRSAVLFGLQGSGRWRDGTAASGFQRAARPWWQTCARGV